MTVTFALAWLVAGLVVGIVATRLYCLRQFNPVSYTHLRAHET